MIVIEFFADDEFSDILDRNPFGEGLLLPSSPSRAAFPFQHPVHSRTIFAVCELINITYSERFFLDFEQATNQAALCLLQDSVVRNWRSEAEILALGMKDPIAVLKLQKSGDLAVHTGFLAQAVIASSSYPSGNTIEDGADDIGRMIDFTDELRDKFGKFLKIANEHASRRGPRKMDHLDDLIDWCCVQLHPEKALPSNQDADDRNRKTKLLRFVEINIRTACLKALRCSNADTLLWQDKTSDINRAIDFYLDWTGRALISRIRERLQSLGAVVSVAPPH